IASGRASSTREDGPGASGASRRAPPQVPPRDTASARCVSRKHYQPGLTAFRPGRTVPTGRVLIAPRNPGERVQMKVPAGPRGLVVLAALTLALPLDASGATWPREDVTTAIGLSTTTVVLPTSTVALPATTPTRPVTPTTVPLPATTLTLPVTTTSVTLPATTLTLPVTTTSVTLPATTLTLPVTTTSVTLPATTLTLPVTTT